MARVITFAKQFPGYHPKAGEPTLFTNKVAKSFATNFTFDQLYKENSLFQSLSFYNDIREQKIDPKGHTIREGNRWKAGDLFSPRFWSGRPRHTPQIHICADLVVVKTYDYEITKDGETLLNGVHLNLPKHEALAKNDGLNSDDLCCWFNKYPFQGQLICWVDPNYENSILKS